MKQVHSGGRTMLRSVGALATWPAIGLRLQDVALLGVFLAAYVGLEWASFMHEHNDLPVTPWNPVSASPSA